MKNPIALDLFCGGGLVARGLLAAGFKTIVGIDIAPHAEQYPGDFIQADLNDNLPVRIEEFDFVWASPPCQRYSTLIRCFHPHLIETYPDFIPRVRELLAGHPMTCIENVLGAPLAKHLRLTGPTVGLNRIQRMRAFELSPEVQLRCGQLPVLNLSRESWERGENLSVTRAMTGQTKYRTRIGLPAKPPIEELRVAMGLDPDDSLTQEQIGEGVPPQYSEYIGRMALR